MRCGAPSYGMQRAARNAPHRIRCERTLMLRINRLKSEVRVYLKLAQMPFSELVRYLVYFLLRVCDVFSQRSQQQLSILAPTFTARRICLSVCLSVTRWYRIETQEP